MRQRFDSLAQQVEHNTFNVGVLGSNPGFEPQADHQKKSQKATTKRQVLQNQYFVGLFLLPFDDLDRQKEGIDGQKLVPNSYPYE